MCWSAAAGPAAAHWHDDVGYTMLESVLGPNLPTGQGVYVSQVEAAGPSGNNYVPDPTHNDFLAASDPLGIATTFVNGSVGEHPVPDESNHATNVARNFYGNSLGLAPASNLVVNYEVENYLDFFLNGSGSTPPDPPTFTDPGDLQTKMYSVQNHSWTGTKGGDDDVYLRKVDSLIDDYELTMSVGVSLNGDLDPDTPSTPPHPALFALLSHSYNAIVVGRKDGLHGFGTTAAAVGYGTGRRKPTLVAGGSGLPTVSSATAAVSGAAAMFHELLAETDGTRSEPMRALLLAGATKQDFANYVDPATGLVDAWARSETQPLDNIFGAGTLNVFNTYLMTLGGQFPGGTATPTPVGPYGWDYNTVSSGTGNIRKYEFEIPEGSFAAEFSIMLTWNVEPNVSFSNENLANLDLTLKSGSTIIDRSRSTVDNHEHIYIGPGQAVNALGPGTYTLEVNTNLSRDYGIAWRMNTLFGTDPENLAPSADFDDDGDVDGSDFLAWQRGLGALLGASHADGDADGDRDVDQADLAIFESQYGQDMGTLLAGIHGVPEPSALAISLVAGLVGVAAARQRQNPR